MLQLPLTPPLLFQAKTSMHGPGCLLRSNCSGSLQEMLPAGLNLRCYREHQDTSQQQRVCLLSSPFLPGIVGACAGRCSNIFRLTPLTVCFPGYCLHQDHNRDINTADWSGGIKDTSTKTGGKCKRKRKHAFQLLIFDFHSALPSNGATATHTSCAMQYVFSGQSSRAFPG